MRDLHASALANVLQLPVGELLVERTQRFRKHVGGLLAGVEKAGCECVRLSLASVPPVNASDVELLAAGTTVSQGTRRRKWVVKAGARPLQMEAQEGAGDVGVDRGGEG